MFVLPSLHPLLLARRLRPVLRAPLAALPTALPTVLLAAMLGGLLLACTSTGALPTTTPTSAASAPAASAPAATGALDASACPAAPDVDRAMEHLRALASTIGVRASTTDAERRAAEYLRAQFEAAGYRATLEAFDVDIPLRRLGSVVLPDGAIVQGAPLNGSVDGEARGPIVFGGLGRVRDVVAVDAKGAVLVVNRGEIPFAEKAREAQDAGATALIVVNNEAGPLRGELTGSPRIPVLGVALEDGPALRALAGRPVVVSIESTRLRGRSQNVVARPSAAPCTAYLGAHYDSVPAGPGAEDNGSGTALLVELARVRRSDGVCFVAFGSEEVGLLGSKAFVRAHGVKGVRFMLNFDMVAKISRPTFIGDAVLAARAVEIARAQGLEARVSTSVGPNAASDHASFAAEGVPVLMFYAGDDPFIHSARDNIENVRREELGRFLQIAVAVLDELAPR